MEGHRYKEEQDLYLMIFSPLLKLLRPYISRTRVNAPSPLYCPTFFLVSLCGGYVIAFNKK